VLQFPKGDGLRVDTGVEAGSEVTSFYDPMIAKLIAHGQSRDQALDRLADALDNTVVVGPRSNAGFLAALCRAEDFRRGDFDTGFIERNLAGLGAVPQDLDRAAAAAGALTLVERESARIGLSLGRELDAPPSPWDSGDAFQLSGARRLALPVLAEGKAVVAQVVYGLAGATVTIEGIAPAADAVAVDAGDAVFVLRHGRQTKVTLRDLTLEEGGEHGQSGLVRAPMHGKVLSILVEQGAHVTRGQRLAIIEAMKMEHTLTAPIDGTVSELTVAADAQVTEGAKVMVIEPAQTPE
jgi:3-methylcrotonyl-CoA carboxylase alpha subunit